MEFKNPVQNIVNNITFKLTKFCREMFNTDYVMRFVEHEINEKIY